MHWMIEEVDNQAGLESALKFSSRVCISMYRLDDKACEYLSRDYGIAKIVWVAKPSLNVFAAIVNAHRSFLALALVGFPDVFDENTLDIITSAHPAIESFFFVDERNVASFFPTSLKNFLNLKQLGLLNCGVSDAGAQAIAQNLSALTSLNLSGNSIGEAGAQAIAQKLSALTSLDLSGNSIGDAGAARLFRAFETSALTRLDLANNPCVGETLSQEIFNTSDARAIISAWRDLIKAEEDGAIAPMNSAKLLVLGEESVGKTSLVRFLTDGVARDPDEQKTPGVRQSEKIETTTWRPEGCDIRVNIWDFAGQEITHGTHRYFLTERSLYLLVLEDRREDNPPAEKWLRTISSVAGDAPVLVIINKSDEGKADLRLDQDYLSREYPQIVGFSRTSCNEDDWSKQSVTALQRLIADTLVDDPRLEAMRDPVPIHWLAIRDEVERRSRESAVLSTEDFKAICVDPAVVEDRKIDSSDLQRGILRLLHEMGVVVAHGLSREAPAAMREITLLDPNWLTDAIYAILNDTKLQERGGRFTQMDLAGCLDQEKYPPERLEFILSMMQHSDIELCFPVEGSKDEFLAPDAMPANSPDFSGWEEGALRFRFRYQQLPRSVMTRFIVRFAQRLASPSDAWRNGARFKLGPSEILVRSFQSNHMIDIAIKGEQRRDALAVLRDAFEQIHCVFDEIVVVARVPMPDAADVEEDYGHLVRLLDEEGHDYRHRPTGAARSYNVAELLELVDRGQSTPAQNAVPPIRGSRSILETVSAAIKPATVLPIILAIVISITLGVGWKAHLGIWLPAAAISAGITWLLLRAIDRSYMFRRLLVLWGVSALGLIGLRQISIALDIQWLKASFGSPDIISILAWCFAGALIGIFAFLEMKRER